MRCTSDIAFYIPVSYFVGSQTTDYVYMYQQWGKNMSSSLQSTGGFEETFISFGDTPISPVPEVASIGPLMAVAVFAVGMHAFGRRQVRVRYSA